jgi:putative oxidoreductase
MIAHWSRIDARLDRWLRAPQAVLLLALRLHLAWIFFKSGLLKAGSWESTLALFEYEYAVPWLSPSSAAWLGTAGELALPPLLALGLFTRPAALALLALNLVACLSYPDISPAGIKDHQLWGLGFAVLCMVGGGALACDRIGRP